MDKLDKTDRKILQLLQQDCRITTKELAEKLHLSNTPVYERVKKLERSGIIKGYVARLDPDKIDRSMMVFISILLTKHTRDVVDKFEAEVLALPEVMEFYYTSGNYDALLKLMVKDMKAFQFFIQEKLSKFEHISRFNSTFVISSADKPGYDL
ncbi:Lrp/AsnC family transcriptional regulator [Labilibaculum sp. K2S]|uniref:Lrp/AsnC family transcriptional regulator n=1 Tax=Labilibaculum sp. K2S TaxID=3056386 RepID=UPI0025A3E4EE|nr:Lrp/AsnC family transcriptional regulator [Labilibaculum sp. K2S]MDM8159160.1 Lrp/AsnC family transcriptional regulator [Labilibaculum sp. K2S]